MSDVLQPTERQRYKFVIEFDGADFSGWQRQIKGTRTVQEVIENALSQILQQKVTLHGSGRTDAGVHALAQIAHADLHLSTITPQRLHLALNSLLPKDVQALALEETSPYFHARFDAMSRSYRYRIERIERPLLRRFAWTPQHEWKDDHIQEVVNQLTGRHCFKSFCLQRPGEEGYFCQILEAKWEIEDASVNFWITGDRFFHKMVRSIVGALMDVGRGRLGVENFRKLLHEPEKHGAVSIAPPHGLTLMRVDYPEQIP